MDTSSDQRNGWKLVPIREVADINPKVDKSAIPDKQMVSFVPMQAVGAGDGSIDVSNLRPAAEVKKGFTNFQEGDILFAKITPCMENGKMAIVPKVASGYGFGSTEFHVLRPKNGLDPRYLYYFVSSQSVRREAAHNMTGAVGQKRVATSYIADLEIPLAPPDQQHLIVAEIEKQFSRLDEAVANLKRVKANLKRYKAAVLKAAVEGKIETGQNEEWQKTTIDDVVELVTKGSSPNWQGFDYIEKGVVFVRSQNVGWGFLDLSETAHLSPSFNQKEKKSVLKTDDVLLNIVGASIGRAALASQEVEGGNVNQAVAVIRPLRTHLLPKFLMYYLLSDKAQKLIHSQKVDVARANYSLEQIRRMPLHLPPLEIQIRIVAEVESRFSIIEEMGTIATLSLTRGERLRQAILSQAFKGNLI